MPGEGRGYRFVDVGNAPEYFANGLHDLEMMGSVARFVLYVLKPGPNGQMFAEAPFTCVMPIEAIGPGIALVVRKCPTLIIPTLGQAARAIVAH